mmetsp:Transcript_23107/g.53417  ORF Transcript_23107/g.53417 Transcript_23107/m.53417 type:complete len:257 (+) Transcript_23107:214-984(+)
MTCVTSGTSMPRPSTSVPMMTEMRPDLKSPRARSRSRWSLSPWTDAAGQPRSYSSASSVSADRFVLTKTIVLPDTALSRSTHVRVLSRPSTCITFCVTEEAAPPTRPTLSITGLSRKLSAMRMTVRGKVAENIIVCLPPSGPLHGMSARSTILRICGSKPMSSIRSASSITRCATLASETLPLSIRSTSRPGVATSSVHPLSRLLIWERISAPPYTTTGKTGERCTNFCDSRKICTASSRVGARMRQRGSAARPYC